MCLGAGGWLCGGAGGGPGNSVHGAPSGPLAWRVCNIPVALWGHRSPHRWTTLQTTPGPHTSEETDRQVPSLLYSFHGFVFLSRPAADSGLRVARSLRSDLGPMGVLVVIQVRPLADFVGLGEVVLVPSGAGRRFFCERLLVQTYLASRRPSSQLISRCG